MNKITNITDIDTLSELAYKFRENYDDKDAMLIRLALNYSEYIVTAEYIHEFGFSQLTVSTDSVRMIFYSNIEKKYRKDLFFDRRHNNYNYKEILIKLFHIIRQKGISEDITYDVLLSKEEYLELKKIMLESVKKSDEK